MTGTGSQTPSAADRPHRGPSTDDGRAGAPAHPRRWLALAVLGTAFFMVILDGTIVYVALPQIERALGFAAEDVQWVMSAYLLTFGGLLLLGGRSADLLGRRRVFIVGVALFVASSLACGLAFSGAVLIAARVVQGASAAIMAPTALSLLMTVFPEGRDRNRALGIWGGIGGIGATAGLLIGGPTTQLLGWQWVFFINVPVGLAVLLLIRPLLQESRDASPLRHLDLAGAVTVTAALVLVVYAIAEAPRAGWTALSTLAALAASAALFALFGWIEARSPAPLVPLRIFRSRTLVGGNLMLLTAGMCIDGTLLIVTFYAQGVLGYSALQFGLMTAVLTGMSVVGAYSAQAIVTRVGSRWVGAAGMALVVAASLLLTRVSVNGSYWTDLFPALVIFGAGLGAAFVASQIAALGGVAEEESGLAAGLADSSFNIGSALGLAVLSTVAVSRAGAVLAGTGREADLQAMTQGFQTAFAFAAGFAVVGLLVALMLLGGRSARDTSDLKARVSD
jgi:EmrB/QacA subfamily drug resistance transporter